MRTYEDRAGRADVVIRLAPPTWLRVARIVRRDGLRSDLLWWTVRYDRAFGDADRRVLRETRGATIEIRSNKALKRLLAVGIPDV